MDILSINETKLENAFGNEVHIPGYEIIRRDSITVFYATNSINVIIQNNIYLHALRNLCLEIQRPRSKPVVVVTWNRAPDAPTGIFSPFVSVIGKLVGENVLYFVMEDLNFKMTSTRFDNNALKLMSISDVYGLQRLMSEPTRIRPTSATLIDLIYANFTDKISNLSHRDQYSNYGFACRKLALNGMSNGDITVT